MRREVLRLKHAENVKATIRQRGEACRAPLLETPGAPQALAARLSKASSWVLDSGANVVIVPPGDPCIVRKCSGEPGASLLVAGDVLHNVSWAIIKTPIGELKGLLVPDAPRLMPMYKVAEGGGVCWRGKTITADHGGKQLKVRIVDNTPELVAFAVRRRRREARIAEQLNEADSNSTREETKMLGVKVCNAEAQTVDDALVTTSATSNTRVFDNLDDERTVELHRREGEQVHSKLIRQLGVHITTGATEAEADQSTAKAENVNPVVKPSHEFEGELLVGKTKHVSDEVRESRRLKFAAKRAAKRGLLASYVQGELLEIEMSNDGATIKETIARPTSCNSCYSARVTSTTEQRGATLLSTSATAMWTSLVGKCKRRRNPKQPSGCELGDRSRIPPEHWATHTPKHPACEHCAQGKAQFPPHVSPNTVDEDLPLGSVLSADLAGPWPFSIRQENFMLVIGTECKRLRFAFPLRGKTPKGIRAALRLTNLWLGEMRDLSGEKRKLKGWIFKTDRGSEFTNKLVEEWILEEGGIWQTVPKDRHVPEAESLVKAVCEGTRTLLSAGGLPSTYWSFACMAYCWNHNLRDSDFRRWARLDGQFADYFAFGRLCYTKTSQGGDLRINKAACRGRPAAFLGPTLDSRKSVWVLVLSEKGKYVLTTATWEGVTFETDTVETFEDGTVQRRPTMAFTRQFKDLQLLCAPGEVMKSQGGPILRMEPGKVVEIKPAKNVTASGGKGRKKTYGDSSCPACRGRHDAHTYSGTDETRCVFSGLDAQKVKRLKKSVKGCTEEILLQAAKRALEGESFSDILEWASLEAKKKALVAHGYLADDAQLDVAALAAFTAVATGVAALDSVLGAGQDQINADKELKRATKERRRYIASPPVRYRPTTTKDKLFEELNKQMLTEQDRERIFPYEVTEEPKMPEHWHRRCVFTARHEKQSARDALRHKGNVGEALLSSTDPCTEKARSLRARRHFRPHKRLAALMTRNLTKSEKVSIDAVKAMQDEARKVERKGTFTPVRSSDMEDDATVSRVHMLSYVKGAELPLAEQIFKGRLVCLGDKIWRALSGEPVYLNGEAYGFRGEIGSLAAFRCVAMASALHGYTMHSADVKTAYLCAEWPSDLPKHYFQVTQQLLSYLSPEMQEKVRQMGGPGSVMLRMDRPLYGHPLAGFIWLDKLETFLDKDGWVPSGLPGHFIKDASDGGTMHLVAYVDDLCVSGPDADVAALWQRLQTDNKETGWTAVELSSVGVTERFLGMRVAQTDKGVYIDTQEYVEDFVAQFKKEWTDRTVYDAWTPMGTELRDGVLVKKPPDGRVLKFVGRLLWISRCARPDVGFAASRLGSRSGTWDDACTQEAARVVGYLRRTSSRGLYFAKAPKETIRIETGIHCDASWRSDRSQSGILLAVEAVLPNEQRVTLGTLNWVSKKQPFVCDSSSASEIVAAHTALRACAPDAIVVSRLFGGEVILWTDNKAVVAAAQGRSQIDWLEQKPMAVRVGTLADAVALGILRVGYIPTEEQMGDGLTKALPRQKLMSWNDCYLLAESVTDGGLLAESRVHAEMDKFPAAASAA